MDDLISRDRRHRLAVVPAIFALLGLPFAPLLLSGLEAVTTGTDHVEDFCRRVGIYGALTAIYRPVINFLKYLF